MSFVMLLKTVITVRVFVGVLSERLVSLTLLLSNTIGLSIVSGVGLIIFHWGVCLFKWRLTSRLNDEFWANFSIGITLILSFAMTFLRMLNGGLRQHFYQVLTGDCYPDREYKLPYA